MITAKQIRAARALLNLRQKDLAELSGLTNVTIANIESEDMNIRISSYQAIEQALIALGVKFFGNDGVSLSEGVIKIYDGVEDLKRFFNELYTQLLIKGGIVRVSGVEESDFISYLGSEFIEIYNSRVDELNVNFKILVGESCNITGNLKANYRKIPAIYFSRSPTFIYDNTVSHIIFEDGIKIITIKSEGLAKAQALLFENIWNNLEPSTSVKCLSTRC